MLGFLNKKTQTVSVSDNSGDAVAENDDDILEVIRSKLRNDNRAESQDRRAHKSSINQGVGHNARTIFTSGDMQGANFNAATSQSVSQGLDEWQSTGNANKAGEVNIDLHKVDEVRDEFEETFHAAHKNISEASFHDANKDAAQSSNNVYINELPEHKNEMWHKEDVMDDIDEYDETNDVAENSMQNVQNHSVDPISVKSDQNNNIDHMNEQMYTSNTAYEDETRSVSNLQQNVANLTPTTQANSKLQSQDFIAPEELSTHEGFC